MAERDEHRGAGDLALKLAASLGVGLIPGPHGTWGSALTAGALALWLALGGGPLTGWGYVLACLAGAAAALWVVDLALRRRVFGDDPDPGRVVIDEMAGQMLALWGVAGPGWELAAGFAAFRVLDIAKPLGIGRLQRLPGTWGVVADDLLAGLYACLLVRLAAWLAG